MYPPYQPHVLGLQGSIYNLGGCSLSWTALGQGADRIFN